MKTLSEHLRAQAQATLNAAAEFARPGTTTIEQGFAALLSNQAVILEYFATYEANNEASIAEFNEELQEACAVVGPTPAEA